MGKQVIYGIGYEKTDPIYDGYKLYINEYKEYLAAHKKVKAAKVTIQLITWLVEESDELHDSKDPTFQKYLETAVRHCKRAIGALERTIDEHLLLM